MTVEIRLISGI